MLSSRTILNVFNRRYSRQLTTTITRHHGQDGLKKIASLFDADDRLSFQSQSQFQQSDLCKRLSSLFNTHYELNINRREKLKTISMVETLDHLGLASTYRDVLSEHKYLVGIHGASIVSLPRLIPNINNIQAMQTYHNPYHAQAGQVYFFYGSNISMALHYSELNSIHTEKIDGQSDPHYYPDRIGVLGFVDQYIIDLINNQNENTAMNQDDEIITAPTIAWKQRNNGTPDEFRIGNEIRLPRLYHDQVFNLTVFKIRGSERLFPLDRDVQYHEGKPCKWVKGVGFVNDDDTPMKP